MDSKALQKTWNVKQLSFWKDLKALDAYLHKALTKVQLYEVYNHYLHYSAVSLLQDKKTAMPAEMFLHNRNGFEIDPS
jgi:hypothetical protein